MKLERFTLPSLQRLARPAVWFGIILLFGLAIWFIYSNWYRVVIDPPALDPAITQKRRTQILVKEYEESVAWDEQWIIRPTPQSVPNVFDRARSTP